MKFGHAPGRRAFSLVELLVVIAIICILAALVLMISGYAHNQSARSLAKTQVASMSAALEGYKATYGDYPVGTIAAGSTASGDSTLLLTNLEGVPGPSHMDFNKSILFVVGGRTNIIDPFGERYGYAYPGSPTRGGTNTFDLWSQGGSTNTNRWITSWD